MDNPSIALVVLDTLRKDAFDEVFDWLPGTSFERAYSTANWTIPAHASMFTGLYPSESSVHSKGQSLDVDQPVLAEHLRNEGYTTVGVSANSVISQHWNFDRGFMEFYPRLETGRFLEPGDVDWRAFLHESGGTGIQRFWDAVKLIHSAENKRSSLLHGFELKFYDHDILGTLFDTPEDYGANEALEIAQSLEMGSPGFLFINLMEAHSPYRVPPEYRTVNPITISGLPEHLGEKPDQEQAWKAYEDCVRYLSDRYRDLFEVLREEFDVIITCSDHGELFGEHDHWAHEYGIFPELVHVPLIISGNEIPDETVSTPVSIRRIYDTILHLAGIHTDRPSLLDKTPANPVFCEYHGLLSWRIDALIEDGYADEVEKYDSPLVGMAVAPDYYGYQTQTDIIESGEASIDSSDEAIEEHCKEIIETDRESARIPEELRTQLRELGYI